VVGTEIKQKRVRLTCKCGTWYTLNTIHDLRSQCRNQRCRATLNLGPDDLWKYQESLMALMEALGLGGEYGRQLDFARKLSKKFESPYVISIVWIR